MTVLETRIANPHRHARFTAHDGMRGACALTIALLHFPFMTHFYKLPFVKGSYLFVDFFFVLSGFVIAAAYTGRIGRTIGAFDFVLRRFGRLWPLHAFMLLLFIANELLKLAVSSRVQFDFPPFHPPDSAGSILPNFLMIQSLGLFDGLTWNNPSWSISVEFAVYMVFLALAFLPDRLRLAVSFLAAAASFYVLERYSPYYMNATYDYGFFRGMYGFCLGNIVFALYARWGAFLKNARHASASAELVLVAIAIGFVTFVGHGPWSVLSPLVFAPLIFVLAGETGMVSSFLKTRPLQALGRWSYSIYLVHYFITVVLVETCKVASKFMGFAVTTEPYTDYFGDVKRVYDFMPPGICDLLAVAYLVVVVAFASQTYRLVERPGQAFFNRIAARFDPKR